MFFNIFLNLYLNLYIYKYNNKSSNNKKFKFISLFSYKKTKSKLFLFYFKYLSTILLAKLLKPNTSIITAPNTYLYQFGNLSKLS